MSSDAGQLLRPSGFKATIHIDVVLLKALSIQSKISWLSKSLHGQTPLYLLLKLDVGHHHVL